MFLNHSYRKSVHTFTSQKAAAKSQSMAKSLRDYFIDKEDKFQLYELRHYGVIKTIKTNISTTNTADFTMYSL